MSDQTADTDELGLNPRQAMFCREYLIDLNASAAYIRAGYSEDGAAQNASILMTNHNVATRIAMLKRDRAKRLEIDADKVLAQISRLAFSDIRRVFHGGSHALTGVPEIDDDTAAAVQSVKVVTRQGESDEDGRRTVEDVIEYKLAEKRGPLDMLLKHLGEGGDTTTDQAPTIVMQRDAPA